MHNEDLVLKHMEKFSTFFCIYSKTSLHEQIIFTIDAVYYFFSYNYNSMVTLSENSQILYHMLHVMELTHTNFFFFKSENGMEINALRVPIPKNSFLKK